MEPAMFIDREQELEFIENAFDNLRSKEKLLRTPIIDFYGIDGIGKTRMLQKVAQICIDNQIPYVESNVSQGISAPFLLQRIHDLTRELRQQLPPSLDDRSSLRQFIAHAQALLDQGPLVMLLDAVDSTNEQHLLQLETLLSELVMYHNFFVVLTSRGNISFEHNRSVSRKLTTISIQPFDQTHSDQYFDSIGQVLTPEIRKLVFAWTRGYPLAMQVMIDAIVEQGIVPGTRHKQKELIEIVADKVVNQHILSNIKKDELGWFQSVLGLLAIPRRFNLVIMQNLIERFEPDLKMASSLGYIVFPKRITEAIGALNWSLAKAGYALDESLRNLLLLRLKITSPQRYYQIHRFLAEMNRASAAEAAGVDLIRYQREYLYHSANSGDAQKLPEILEKVVEQISQESALAPQRLAEFREEFLQDEELREALGQQVTTVLALVDSRLVQHMREFVPQEEDEEKRLHYLRDFFIYIVHDRPLTDLPLALKEEIYQFLAREKPEVIATLYVELAQHEKARDVLREAFPHLSTPRPHDTEG